MTKYKDLATIYLKYQQYKITRLELEILLCHVLKIDRVQLKAYPDKLIPEDKLAKFYQLIERRINQEPMGYIVGHKQFWDLDLVVTKDVLIPRADTEILVEQSLNILNKLSKMFKEQVNRTKVNRSIRILELGTGSGAIALAIAKQYPNYEIVATDISLKALQIAELNAKQLNINNIKFLVGDWFVALATNNLNYKFDIIISNPPYISINEINLCDPEIFFEPQQALFAGNNGMDCFNNIIVNCQNYLDDNGYLLLEHGVNQGQQLINLMRNNNFQQITAIKDPSKINRVLVGKFSENST